MRTLLDVEPGTVTPLALLNDTDGAVTFVIDADLLDAEQLNFHPMIQTESIGLSPAQLAAFLDSCAHPPLPVSLS